MHNIDQSLREYRNNELIVDYKSLFSEPVLTTSLYKKDAAKTYTQEIYKEVKREIEKAGALNVIQRSVSGEKLLFKLGEYCNRDKERSVDYDPSRSDFSCECRLFQSRGIPCSHIICVMKIEHVDHIPRSLILARWTKYAKRNFMSANIVQELPSDVTNSSQIVALSAAFRRLCSVTEKKRSIFNDLMDDVFNVVEKYEKIVGEESSERSSVKVKEVRDPTIVKTKGAPKKKKFATRRKKHCSNCTSIGHTIRSCPMRNGLNAMSKKDLEKLSSDSSDTCKDLDNDKESPLNEGFDDGDNVDPEAIGSQNVKKGKDKVEGSCKRKKTKAIGTTQESLFRGFEDGDNDHPKDIGSQNDKKGKDKVDESSKRKKTNVYGKTHESEKKCEISGCSTGVRPVVTHEESTLPEAHIPQYGQGVTLNCNVGVVPVYPNHSHNGQLPIYHHNSSIPGGNQVPEFFSGMENLNNGTSISELLQQVMKNGGQNSNGVYNFQ
ncbi:Zinc finger, PMZ-type [Sesbania bispinosa]|nr:Zinc finger, PMZ-type [Sesbania bispinosa]